MLDKVAEALCIALAVSAMVFYIACSVRVLCAAFAVM